MIDFETLKALTIPEGEVIKITKLDGSLLWEAVTSRLPKEYQEVEWLQAQADVYAYLNLGFSFDTKARIYISQWIFSTSVTTYPFGAAENSGKLRCMLSSPYSGSAGLYGSNGSSYMYSHINYYSADSVSGYKHEFYMHLEPGDIHIENLTSGKIAVVQTEQAAYTMTNNLYLFAQNYNGEPRVGGIRRIGMFRYYDKNDVLICDLVPCYRKSDRVPGMYDVVRKIFLTSIGAGAFALGPLVVGSGDIELTNWARCSINADGTIYNDGLGYKEGWRVRSGGAEAEVDIAVCTGFIPFKKGDTLRIYPAFQGDNAQNAINFADSGFTNLGQVTDNGSTAYGICASAYATYKSTVIDGVSTLTYDDSFDSNIAYVRITHSLNQIGNGATLLITKNEEIV